MIDQLLKRSTDAYYCVENKKHGVPAGMQPGLDAGLEGDGLGVERRPGEVNTNDGGRGVYWEDPSGHVLEILTRPYGSGS